MASLLQISLLYFMNNITVKIILCAHALMHLFYAHVNRHYVHHNIVLLQMQIISKLRYT
jgi:hypothetical protein